MYAIWIASNVNQLVAGKDWKLQCRQKLFRLFIAGPNCQEIKESAWIISEESLV